MNQSDRKVVKGLLARLEAMASEAEEIAATLQDMADAEQEKFDNLSPGLQESEKGQKIGECATYLFDAADSADNGNVKDAAEALGNIEGINE